MIASLKSIGEKTANIFDRKKKEVEQLASEKANEAHGYAEEQAKKAGDSIDQTAKEAGQILSSTGVFSSMLSILKQLIHSIISCLYFGIYS